jgi:3-oxoacyl-[acyl-carrier protein] reductase
MSDLVGKKAIVCGSTEGIGKATAKKLADKGASVILIARNEQKLINTLPELNKNFGQKHQYIVADFNFPYELQVRVEEFLSENENINILINNTGGPPGGSIHQAKTDEFIHAFNAHLICNHVLVKACLEGMKLSGYGRIINIISTSVKQPLPNLGVSNTVRGAVASWAKTMANELGKYGITVNNVLPGATATNRLESIINNKAQKLNISPKQATEEMLHEIPLQRFAKPEEIAAAVAFLASPDAAYINGINLPVDGGRTSCL